MQREHGRVPGVVQVRHGFVGAVDGQRVLDQVVGADRHEVEVPQEAVKHQRGGRHLDHRADFDVVEGTPASSQLLACARASASSVSSTSRSCATIGISMLHLAEGAGPQDRPQLLPKHAGLGQAPANGAQSQRRVERVLVTQFL